MTGTGTAPLALTSPAADLGAGPLTGRVLAYGQAIQGLVPTVREPADWAPLAEHVTVDAFERVGTFGEVQDWARYTEMLTRWATATDRFETTVRRTAEIGDLVYFEIEERHHRGDAVTAVPSLTVFRFDASQRIEHLAVYFQQPR
jgi:predicted SnoaL-like aldol condensation-catalyzing enzyme